MHHYLVYQSSWSRNVQLCLSGGSSGFLVWVGWRSWCPLYLFFASIKKKKSCKHFTDVKVPKHCDFQALLHWLMLYKLWHKPHMAFMWFQDTGQCLGITATRKSTGPDCNHNHWTQLVTNALYGDKHGDVFNANDVEPSVWSWCLEDVCAYSVMLFL